MTRVEVKRHVAADPASVALLLAGPASERDPDNGLVIAAPRRTGIGFTAAIKVTDAMGRAVTGDIRIRPAPDTGTDVTVVIRVADERAGRGVERTLSGFASELAARARSRSFAA
jgi:hypothetical protein